MSQLPLSQLSASSFENTPSPRRAAPRFSAEEKSLLAELVNERVKYLECKRTDVASLAKKNEVWKEVAKIFNSHHGVTRRDVLQLKKCWANLKQKWKEGTATERRERHKTGGGSAPAALDPLIERVGAVVGHMATRIRNEFDSDAALYQPPVHSLPVVRLLQPMVDGAADEADFDYTDEWESSTLVEPGGHCEPAVSAASSAPEPALDGDSNLPPVVRPDAAVASTVDSGADASCPTAPEAAACGNRAPRGRMALLEKSLGEENEKRASLLQEEHTVRLQLMGEDHQSVLKQRESKTKLEERESAARLQLLKDDRNDMLEERRKKRKFEEQMREMELQQRQLDLQERQQKIKFEEQLQAVELERRKLEVQILKHKLRKLEDDEN